MLDGSSPNSYFRNVTNQIHKNTYKKSGSIAFYENNIYKKKKEKMAQYNIIFFLKYANKYDFEQQKVIHT